MNARVALAGPLLLVAAVLLPSSCGDDGGGGTGASGTGGSSTGTGTGSCTDDDTCAEFCDIGCGPDCPPCPSNSEKSLTCTSSGLCKCDSSCTPDCSGKDCGDDGCGGICGTSCGSGEVCTYDGNGSPEWTCQPFSGPSPDMSFFVTARGLAARGGDLGGLEGADGFCQSFAEGVGVTGKTWHAYLSAGNTAARDRIGDGPWKNSAGASIVDEACGGGCVDALHQAGIPAELALTEYGTQVDWTNAHDILTGSTSDGTPTGSDCEGWTSRDEFDSATVGHVNEESSWASSHDTGCDQVGMQCTAGQGHIYCFAE